MNIVQIYKHFINWGIWKFGDSGIFGLHEPRHDKINKMDVHPAKTQISRGICSVWSESSLRAKWVAKNPRFLHTDSEDSDQAGRMPRLIWIFAVCTLILLVLTYGGSYGQSDLEGSAI